MAKTDKTLTNEWKEFTALDLLNESRDTLQEIKKILTSSELPVVMLIGILEQLKQDLHNTVMLTSVMKAYKNMRGDKK